MITDMKAEARLVARALAQDQIITWEQLLEVGLSEPQVKRASEAGLLRRVFPGVYRLPGPDLTFEQRARAALAASGPGAVLSHRTAGVLLGYRRLFKFPIDVTTHDWHRPLKGVKYHRTDTLRRRDVRELDNGLVVTSPHRTLFGLAWLLPLDVFESVWEDARLKGHVSVGSGRAFWEDLHARGRNGSHTFGRWVRTADAAQPPAESDLEVLVLQAMRRRGLPEPVRQHRVRLPNGRRARLDVAYVDLRLDIEPGHTWWHRSPQRQRDDELRDHLLAQMGWEVMRADEHVVEHEIESFVDEVAATYHRLRSAAALSKSAT